jgi:hypothetical protein
LLSPPRRRWRGLWLTGSVFASQKHFR